MTLQPRPQATPPQGEEGPGDEGSDTGKTVTLVWSCDSGMVILVWSCDASKVM